MFQRIFAICAVAFLFTACETASNVAGDSASGSSSSSATAAGAGSSSSSSSTTATQMSDAEKLAQVGNSVYFGFDSSELNSKAQAILDRQAAFLNVNPTVVSSSKVMLMSVVPANITLRWAIAAPSLFAIIFLPKG